MTLQAKINLLIFALLLAVAVILIPIFYQLIYIEKKIANTQFMVDCINHKIIQRNGRICFK